MSIRNRLTLQFALLSTLVLGLASVAIYVLSSDYREDEFAQRLVSRGENTAKLLIQVDEVDGNLLNIIERDNPVRLPEEEILIYNFKDSLIYRSEKQTGALPERAFLDQVRLEGNVRLEDKNRETKAFLFTDRYDRFVVIVSATDIYGRSKLSNLAQVLISVLMLSMLTFGVVGRIYAERALNPIKQLVKEIMGITISNLNQRVSEGDGKDEIAQLAVSFNAMLVRLEAAFQVQRNFIANASHEMRTPLTAISGQLEVLLLKERSAQEYRNTVDSVLNDIHRLNRLANRLLMLAQTATDAPEAGFSPVRLDDMLWEARADLIKAKPVYKVDVTLAESITDLESLVIQGSDILLKTMLLNLMENGCKYSDNNAVFVTIGVQEQMAMITVTDDGIGISDQDLPNIFEPFFRSNSIRNSDGHGIGLSLVQRIVNLHRGSVSVSSTFGQGSKFKVNLPLVRSIWRR